MLTPALAELIFSEDHVHLAVFLAEAPSLFLFSALLPILTEYCTTVFKRAIATLLLPISVNVQIVLNLAW
jgi:hypothetical protein